MLKRESVLFRFVDWLGRPRTVLILTVLELAVLGTVNGLDFPLSVPYLHRVTGQGYLDFCSFCTSTAVQTQVDALGVQGRMLQALLLCSIDIVIPTLSCLFGIAALSALTRSWRVLGSSIEWVLALPVIAMLLDFAENGTIVGLLIRYPARAPVLAGLEGLFSGLKTLAYGSVLASIVILLIVHAVRRPRTAEVES